MSPKDKVYIEENRFCEESYCKHLKRLIVGMIRFSQSEGRELKIPEHFFDNVPDSTGFSIDLSEGDLRWFKLNNDWVSGIDDCGGTEFKNEDVVYSFTKSDNLVHLKLVPNE